MNRSFFRTPRLSFRFLRHAPPPIRRQPIAQQDSTQALQPESALISCTLQTVVLMTDFLWKYINDQESARVRTKVGTLAQIGASAIRNTGAREHIAPQASHRP
jgi:hypothetical protein